MSKITDARPAFFMVEDEVFNLGLTPFEGWVYMAILKHANRQTGVAFPGIGTLAKLCQMSKSQVMRCIASLEAKQIIEVERDSKPAEGEKRKRENNHYIVKSLVGSVSQEVGVVSHSDYPSSHQTLGVVSTRDNNHIKRTRVNNHIASGDATPAAAPDETPKRKPHKNAAWHDALVLAFGVKPDTLTKTADGLYWKVAAELAKINFPVDQIGALYQFVKLKAHRERWSSFSVNSLAKYAPSYLATLQPKVTPKDDFEIPADWYPRTDDYLPLDAFGNWIGGQS